MTVTGSDRRLPIHRRRDAPEAVVLMVDVLEGNKFGAVEKIGLGLNVRCHLGEKKPSRSLALKVGGDVKELVMPVTVPPASCPPC